MRYHWKTGNTVCYYDGVQDYIDNLGLYPIYIRNKQKVLDYETKKDNV